METPGLPLSTRSPSVSSLSCPPSPPPDLKTINKPNPSVSIKELLPPEDAEPPAETHARTSRACYYIVEMAGKTNDIHEKSVWRNMYGLAKLGKVHMGNVNDKFAERMRQRFKIYNPWPYPAPTDRPLTHNEKLYDAARQRNDPNEILTAVENNWIQPNPSQQAGPAHNLRSSGKAPPKSGPPVKAGKKRRREQDESSGDEWGAKSAKTSKRATAFSSKKERPVLQTKSQSNPGSSTSGEPSSSSAVQKRARVSLDSSVDKNAAPAPASGSFTSQRWLPLEQYFLNKICRKRIAQSEAVQTSKSKQPEIEERLTCQRIQELFNEKFAGKIVDGSSKPRPSRVGTSIENWERKRRNIGELKGDIPDYWALMGMKKPADIILAAENSSGIVKLRYGAHNVHILRIKGVIPQEVEEVPDSEEE